MRAIGILAFVEKDLESVVDFELIRSVQLSLETPQDLAANVVADGRRDLNHIIRGEFCVKQSGGLPYLISRSCLLGASGSYAALPYQSRAI